MPGKTAGRESDPVDAEQSEPTAPYRSVCCAFLGCSLLNWTEEMVKDRCLVQSLVEYFLIACPLTKCLQMVGSNKTSAATGAD